MVSQPPPWTPDDPTEPGGSNAARGPLVEAASPLRAGNAIDGKYLLLRKIGAGAMGEVWEVRHQVVGRAFALKALLRPGARTAETEAAERIVREARLISRIDHPNVIDVTDAGHLPHSGPYYVMELLDGRSLKDVIAREGALPWPRARNLMVQIAEGLGAAHAAGILHRDLKPANVVVVSQGETGETVKLIDFGIARSLTLDAEARRLTKSGAIFGTPTYMSPEQARGEGLDARSDIYSLGCVMYELLTGRRPFAGNSVAEILAGHLFRPPDPLGVDAVPAELESAVMRCLEKDRSARFEDARGVVAALTSIAGTQRRTVAAEHRPAPPTGDVRPVVAENPLAVRMSEAPAARPSAGLLVGGFIGLAGLGFAIVLAIMLWPRDAPSPPSPVPETKDPVTPAVAAPTPPDEPSPAEPEQSDRLADPIAAEERDDSLSADERGSPEAESAAGEEPQPPTRSAPASRKRRSRETPTTNQEPSAKGSDAKADDEPLPPRRREDGTFDLFPD